MTQYNLNAKEISKLVELYSKIKTQEKRLFAQGYLNGLADSQEIEILKDQKPA